MAPVMQSSINDPSAEPLGPCWRVRQSCPSWLSGERERSGFGASICVDRHYHAKEGGGGVSPLSPFEWCCFPLSPFGRCCISCGGVFADFSLRVVVLSLHPPLGCVAFLPVFWLVLSILQQKTDHGTSIFYCGFYGRKIHYANSKTLVGGGCRDRPSRALPLTCPNVVDEI